MRTANYNIGKIEKWQLKAIYKLGNELRIVDATATKEGQMDNLHLLVYGITHKEHISDLTYGEANNIIDRLKDMMRLGNRPIEAPSSPASSVRGMISEGQKKKIWKLVFLLKEYDSPGKKVSTAARIKGILKLYAGIDAHPKEPFKFLTYEKASDIIESLKKLIANEEKKLRKIQSLQEEALQVQSEMELAEESVWSELNDRLKQLQREIDVLQASKEY